MNRENRANGKDNWKIIYGAIFSISIFALIIGYLIEHFKPLMLILKSSLPEPGKFEYFNSLLAHLFNEAGVAGLIACGLAVTIERLSANEFIKLASDERAAVIDQSRRLAAEERKIIKEDVFYYVFGHDIPQEIRKEITTQILKAIFIRKKLSMIYTLSSVEDIATRSTYVLVDLLMSYDIENLTSERQPLIVRAAFKKPPITSLADQAKFTSIEVVGCENPIMLQEGQIPIKPIKDNISLDYNEPVWIKSGTPTRVTIHSQTIKHYTGGTSNFVFDYHTCDLDLSVHVIDRSLQVYAGASTGGEWLKETSRHKPINGYYNWEIHRPLLAFQGIHLTWIPVVLDNAASSKDTAKH
jgi:hypothetical protein